MIDTDSCYILLHRDRSSNRDRTRNLMAVINHIRKGSDISILVMEQDKEPNKSLSEKLSDLSVNYQFLYNPGLFNRAWGYNCAVCNTTCLNIVLADNDLILDTEDLNRGLILLSQYDVIKPFQTVYDLNLDDTLKYITINNFNPTLDKPRVNLTAGGLLMMTKKAFLTIGGYDERFEGWGGEDDEMTKQLWKYINNKQLTYYGFGNDLLHLYHDRTVNDSWTQPNYHNNCSFIYDNRRNQNITIGQFNKYVNRIYGKFMAFHKYWSNEILLYNDHTFTGGAYKPNGLWYIDTNQNLVLQWYDWPEDILKPNEEGYYNESLSLKTQPIIKNE